MSIIVRSNEPVTQTPPAQTEGVKSAASNEADKSAPEANASEHKESRASETQETEEEESDSEGSESDQDAEEKDSVKDEKPKKKGGFQRRIDKLNQRYAQKEQELEYWRQQALKGDGDSKTDAPKADSKQAQASDGKPKADDFETHAEFVEALTDWKTDQKLAEREKKQEQSRLAHEQQSLVKSHAERVQSFAEKTEDFQDVLENVDDIQVSAAVREIILQSDNGPELMYELAKNRDEYARICNLSPLAAAREMGKIEAKFAAPSSAEKKPEPQKITKAPKPLDPIGTGGKGAVAKSLSDPNLSQAEYERLRAEQIKKRRQA